MTVFVSDCDGKVIHRSKNLRGILDYNRHPLRKGTGVATVIPGDWGRATLRVEWSNGSTASAGFASESLCREWAAKRFKVFDNS